jgi:hypothetical protein
VTVAASKADAAGDQPPAKVAKPKAKNKAHKDAAPAVPEFEETLMPGGPVICSLSSGREIPLKLSPELDVDKIEPLKGNIPDLAKVVKNVAEQFVGENCNTTNSSMPRDVLLRAEGYWKQEPLCLGLRWKADNSFVGSLQAMDGISVKTTKYFIVIVVSRICLDSTRSLKLFGMSKAIRKNK